MAHKKGTILMKFGITNPDILKKILTVAEKEGGHIYEAVRLLHYTGMHPSSLMGLHDITHIVDKTLRWRRPKTKKVLSVELKGDMYQIAEQWLTRKKRYSQSWLNQEVKQIGIKAGYPDLAPTTFRHTKCLELIKENKDDPLMTTIVSQKLGCTEGVVWRNYARLKELEG
jgi:integrase